MTTAPTTRRTSGTRTTDGSTAAGSGAHHRNEVQVTGRLAAAAEARELPSGDQLVLWRLIVERDGAPQRGRPHLDTLECVAWQPRLQRSALAWQPGDTIDVTGALRRRFWRAATGVSSRYEVEVRAARRLARARP